MLIIGCDYHPSFQQIAYVDNETGELGERRLLHREEGEQFYSKLREQSAVVRVGMEASGHARWFERLLHGLQFELWVGNAAEIRRDVTTVVLTTNRSLGLRTRALLVAPLEQPRSDAHDVSSGGSGLRDWPSQANRTLGRN